MRSTIELNDGRKFAIDIQKSGVDWEWDVYRLEDTHRLAYGKARTMRGAAVAANRELIEYFETCLGLKV